MLTMGSAEHKSRVDSERNQGRAPDMGWLDHDRLGFNYRITDIQAAIGLCQLDRLDGMRELGVQSKPYLPAIHLMSYYRETFGHRPGEFPVCEDVAGRSVALPFFPEITQSQ